MDDAGTRPGAPAWATHMMLVFWFGACGAEPEPTLAGAGSSTTDEHETVADEDLTDDTSGGPDASSSESSGGVAPLEPSAPGPAATGITLDGVVVNQGVAVKVAHDGQLLDARTAEVLAARRTWVAASWTAEDSFVPRPIWAVLHLYQPDGSVDTLSTVATAGGDSDVGPEDDNFRWIVGADRIDAATRWTVSLHEDEQWIDGVSDAPPNLLPDFGTAPLVDDDGEQRLSVVVVPLRHQLGECDNRVPTGDGFVSRFAEALLMRYPVQHVDVQLHDEVIFTGQSQDLYDAIDVVRALRSAESPEPDVYYYGLLRNCEPSEHGGLGYRLEEPASLEDAYLRVGVGLSYDPDAHGDAAERHTFSTAIHEIAHNHGRRHVGCPGSEGSDPDYPRPDGTTGYWGWGVVDGEFRAPTLHDFMAGCDPGWVSAYGWSWTLAVVNELRDNLAAPQQARAPGVGSPVEAIASPPVTGSNWEPPPPSVSFGEASARQPEAPRSRPRSGA